MPRHSTEIVLDEAIVIKPGVGTGSAFVAKKSIVCAGIKPSMQWDTMGSHDVPGTECSLDGQGKYRIFDIRNSNDVNGFTDAKTFEVHLEGLTLKNAYVAGGGAAITTPNCYATALSGMIPVENAKRLKVTTLFTHFEDNKATDGGAAAFVGCTTDFFAEHDVFVRNKQTGDVSLVTGGGVFYVGSAKNSNKATLTASASLFEDNTAVSHVRANAGRARRHASLATHSLTCRARACHRRAASFWRARRPS